MDGKLESLQAARAVAALSVAYYHSYVALRGFPDAAQLSIPPLKAYGYLGVNFFFAISGYVICLVVSRPSFTPATFAIKRLFRLYPMYWVAMLVIAAMIMSGYYRVETLGHFLYSMTLLPQQGNAAYDVSWTLEREVVFYVLAMIVVPSAGTRGLAAVLAMLAAAGWYFGNPWTFHLVSTMQADFLAGVLVFLLGDRARKIGPTIPLAIGCALLWISQTSPFAFSIPLAMASALLGMLNLRLPWRRWPFRIIVATGDASYSIYLLHYILFYWAASTSARLPWKLNDWLCEPWRFAAILVCCAVSYLTWRVIEVPAIKLGNALSRKQEIASPARTKSVGAA